MVTPAVPAIVTHASATVVAGGAIADTATLSGGTAPTGTVTFTLFGPNNATCTGAAIFTSTITVTGNGNYTSADFTANLVGTYQFKAAYSGDANNTGVTSACGAANESAVVVTPTTPTISTVASAPVTVGGTITDTATLAGGVNPTGTITFTVFGPNNATCGMTPAFTSTSSVNANGAYTSNPFTVTLARTYRFEAAYSGDANNAPAARACNAANENVLVSPTTPGLVTVASGNVPAGGAISDTATLSGGVNPTGTITFTLFGPNNATCTGTAIFTSTATVTGNGTYPSGSFTTVSAGTYQWVAVYSGDANNSGATGACGAANEATVVTKAGPAIATQASGPVTVGSAISDTASLTGGTGPTGTITFTVFGPANATCTGTVAFTSTVPVAGNGNYLSGPFTPTAPGTYEFVASYSGDANNAAAGPTACGVLAETVVVATANTTIVTHASGSVTVGGTITDTATLAGGVTPTGSITFQVFGPNNATCTGIPAFTSVVTVAGNGNYTSAPFTVAAAGSYEFVATYSGDANNSPAGPTACSDANEVSAGTKASPAITTTASASATVGGAINDTAILTAGFNPTGTITFNGYGPNTTTCTGTPTFTSTVTVNGTGNYTSASFTPTAPGSYQFVASYSGDANNNPFGPTACNVAAETVSVTPVAVSLSTTASPTSDVGQAIFDTATLGGTAGPTGTITFTLFGPNDATCANAAAFTSTVTVNGTGNYPSASFTPTVPGTYEFVATYSGDATNAPSGPTPCNDPAESVVVLPLPQIGVTKVANPLTEPEPGGNFTFTVTVNNPSAVDPVKITSLFDNIYGDLSTRPGSTCGTLIGVTLAPGAMSPPCTFTGAFTGKGGASQTDTVTVTGVDSHGVMVSATAHATVTLTTVLPSISVTKVATPLTLPEPGGNFTFTVQVTNNNTIDPITITALTDNIYGNLATRAGSTCGSLIGTTLAPGAMSPPCSFTGPFNGTAPASQTDTVTVTGMDANGNTATATAHATVTLTAVTPVIAVTKAANPLSEPAPGGNFTFTVQVSNPSATDPIKITSLTDNIYGNLATLAGSTCGALIGTTLAPGGVSAPCAFTGAFNGVAGASQTDTVTVDGVDPFGNTATANANATVILTPGVLPQIAVSKVANPLSEPAPGGNFTFTVQVTNPSTTVPVKITSLTDNVYGNLATLAGSTCSGLIGTTLAPGATSAPCSFTGSFNGVSGASQTDTVTVTGVDSNGNMVTATAQATVTLTPELTPVIAVTKAASPPSLPAPGGNFTFTVQVSNPSTTDPIKITALTDNIYGNLATLAGSTCGALIGTTLAPGATSAPCTFTGPFTGVSGASQTDTVTATGVDSNGNTATATAQATVTLTPGVTPQIAVSKAANPLSMPAPGGNFTFTVQVTNPSATDPVKITSLVDNIYGDLATRTGSTCGTLIGTTLAPGATSAPCTFSGSFTGVSGASQTDTVTVTGVDNNGNTVTATAHATVTLTPAPTPEIAVSKVANPLSLPAPGGSFTFTVQVSNPSTTVPVKITSLVDNVYGNLATLAGSTCGALIGVTLAPGATSAPCSFTGSFTGVSGASQTDTVTVTGINPNNPTGPPVTATAMATVTLTPPVLPQIGVTKAASPPSLPAPGGNFTFTVQVSNPSTTDPVKITSLVDNIYGNLATLAGSTCGSLIGTTLAPGATSAPCTFTGAFTGVSGASQTDIVTVTGTDNNGNTVTATAKATVVLTPPPTPVIAVSKAADPVSLPQPGGTFTFTVIVTNPSTVDPITITSLVDNIYGNLATLPGSTCGNLIGTTLAPGASSPSCSFTGPFTGNAGASQTDTVTVTGTDSNGNTATSTAKATVTITPPTALPQIGVTKTASPLSLSAPGGNFTFTVTVSNPSTVDPVTITSLVDNIYGNLATLPGSTCGSLIGTTLAPGATSPPCSFVGMFTGKGGASQTDTVTVTGKDSNGNTTSAMAKATVTLITVTPVTPVLTVTKSASPLTLPQPGGTFTFTVAVTNPSTSDPVTITSVDDNIYGNLATRAGSTCSSLIGLTLAPGATSPSCSFTGAFTGAGGASQTDVVTVGGTDKAGTPVSATAAGHRRDHGSRYRPDVGHHRRQ